jgi:DNA-binding IclR family transcriptional regulator
LNWTVTVINSVLKAIKVLELFTPENPQMTLSDISKCLDMPKSTVHNLLNTLMSEGYIEQDENTQYGLGTAVIALTQNVRVNVEVRDRAAPLLRELADLCDESVYLTVYDNGYALYIYAIESSQRLLARTAVGDRANLHCTSVGKAIMANLPDEEVDAIIERIGLPKYTQTTIVDVEQLKSELQLTRDRGYSIDNQEHEDHVYCIGAPIFDSQGIVCGSCSVSGIDPQIVGARIPEISNAVIRTAMEISRRMGYVTSMKSVIHSSQRLQLDSQ